ncbi:MAG TPA: hypothetical protein VE991_12720 [Acidimicrobiales bacterium]|nr:hypothetical protein [Acidimicrobiales bacterium]
MTGASRPAAVRPMVGAVVTRPGLWVVAVVEALRLARPGWWRRWPPVPLPDPELWRFRMETAYGGDGDAVPTPEDVRTFLHWCREMHHWRKR